jgi:archaeosine-15-forming tRNA-guanine transglycosylase
MTDDELDTAIRQSEAVARQHAARHAALLAVSQARGSYRADGHRTMTAYLRATCNTSGAQIADDRKLARLVDARPEVGDALSEGHISVGHALQIGRILANPRIAHLLALVVHVFVDLAEHRSFDDFRGDIDEFIRLTDQDGAFADLASAHEGRNAHVNDVGGTLSVSVEGGDPVTTMQFIAVFESFVEGEFRKDVEARREQYGNEADRQPLPRTAAHRRYDAIITMAAAAAAFPEGRALPEPTVHIVTDERSAHETLTHAGITLPNGNVVELDADGNAGDEAMLMGLADELLADPEAFRSRRCETSTGAKINPIVALRALLTGHVRRVVVDSQGVVIDYGTKQRLFSGSARAAALLLASTCNHPGCRLAARDCQVDHVDEWTDGGRTDQRNSGIECGGHNRFKHRERWTTRRDSCGRVYSLRPDGTIVLPVGERPPDLTADELARAARNRLVALRS